MTCPKMVKDLIGARASITGVLTERLKSRNGHAQFGDTPGLVCHKKLANDLMRQTFQAAPRLGPVATLLKHDENVAQTPKPNSFD